MNLQLLYFAQLREKFGRAQETIEAPASVHTVADLIAHLASRGGIWQETFSGEQAFRVAINQDMVELTAVLSDGAEVAIFRPVTGG
jgi:molybdopterin synthase sulfur carrier subunit